MDLIEPLGLLRGRAARDALAGGLALPLAGGPAAFSLARLPDRSVRSVRDLPPGLLERLTACPPPWAGLPISRPLVMGIVNATPDSFSDGGRHDNFLAHARRMVAEGADLIDVGGESTRPSAYETPAIVEQARILPLVCALVAEDVVVSVDTRHADTMAAALDAGARIVNDVSGLSFDPAAAPLLRGRTCPVVLMHMRGVPSTMQGLADYGDVVADVTRELALRLAESGLDPARVAVDPGIGFAKGPEHNEAILARLPMLLNLGCRILVGVSRKGFIARLSGEADPEARVPGSLAAGIAAVLGGAAILRVHDVAATVQALRVWHGIEAAA